MPSYENFSVFWDRQPKKFPIFGKEKIKKLRNYYFYPGSQEEVERMHSVCLLSHGVAGGWIWYEWIITMCLLRAVDTSD